MVARPSYVPSAGRDGRSGWRAASAQGYPPSVATPSSAPSPYAQLPPRREDLRTSLDVESHPEELEDGFREDQWLLRASAG
ncbi:hypothetical protein GCM10023339_30510 [Alloalcanivorax gelatiniphagus]